KEIIGTAVYFSPAVLSNDSDPLHLKRQQGETRTQFGGEPNGRYVVPLPHPSGASLWPNQPANQALIGRALALLSDIRQAWQL
ncbi:MAG: hypothetical protein KDD89_15495, partial [Anaerolineales bacterium]|nr:hypothetical protein [Anaerolineales bacterium]